jgi:hypothetical protein
VRFDIYVHNNTHTMYVARMTNYILLHENVIGVTSHVSVQSLKIRTSIGCIRTS